MIDVQIVGGIAADGDAGLVEIHGLVAQLGLDAGARPMKSLGRWVRPG